MVKVKDDDETPATVDSQWEYIEVVNYWAIKWQQKCLYPSLDFKCPGDKYNPGGSRWGKVAVTIVAAWKYHCQVWRQEVGSSGFVVH